MDYQRCAICGRTEIEAEIHDAIEGDEIKKICEFCAEVNDVVLIKKPTISQLKEADRTLSVIERLSRAAGMKFDAESLKAREEKRKREQQIALAKLAAKRPEHEKGMLDFKSATLTIADLRRIKEEMSGSNSS